MIEKEGWTYSQFLWKTCGYPPPGRVRMALNLSTYDGLHKKSSFCYLYYNQQYMIYIRINRLP
jgi:hypothetical protein